MTQNVTLKIFILVTLLTTASVASSQINFENSRTKKNEQKLKQRVLKMSSLSPSTTKTKSSSTENPLPVKSWEVQLAKKPNDITTREQLSKYYLDEKNYKKVIELTSAYTDKLSNKGLLTLSKAYGQLGQYTLEINILNTLGTKLPQSYLPNFLLAEAYLATKNEIEAIKNLRESINKNKKHRESYEALLKIYEPQKNYYESRLILADMIKVFGKSAQLLTPLCQYYYSDGYLNEAIKICSLATRFKKTEPVNFANWGKALNELDNQAKAKRVLLSGFKKYPFSPEITATLGGFYFAEKSYTMAIKYLSESVRLDPNQLETVRNLAVSYYEMSQYENSLKYLLKACDLDKSNETYDIFRSSESRLRQKNDYQSAEKFKQKLYLCRTSLM